MDNIIAQLEQIVILTRDFLAEPHVLTNKESLDVLQLMSQWNTYLSKLLEMIKDQTGDERKKSFHELCRPLNGICGSLNVLLLENSLEASQKTHFQEFLDKVADVLKNVKHVVKEMGVHSYWCGD